MISNTTVTLSQLERDRYFDVTDTDVLISLESYCKLQKQL